MAITGVDNNIAHWVLSKARRLDENLHPHLDEHAVPHFAAALSSSRPVPLDADHLAVLGAVRDEVTANTFRFAPLDRVVRAAEERLLPVSGFHPPHLFQPGYPLPPIVESATRRTHPAQLTWMEHGIDESLFTHTLGFSHSYHFARFEPGQVLGAIGNMVDYNIAGPDAHVYHFDIDPHQVLAKILWTGLFLTAETPETFAHQFLRLSDPNSRAATVTEVFVALRRAERSGLIPPGRSQLFWSMAHRTDDLGLTHILEAYRSDIAAIAHHEELSDSARVNFAWLEDRLQFDNLLKIHRGGQHVSLQVDIFDPLSVRQAMGFLRDSGRPTTLTSLYLANPQDTLPGEREWGWAWGQLGQVVGELDFASGGRVQWTSLDGLPVVGNSQGRLVESENTQFPDTLSEGETPYAYVDMPVDEYRAWLNSVPAGAEGLAYYEALNARIADHGIFQGGLLTIPCSVTTPEGQALSADSSPILGMINTHRTSHAVEALATIMGKSSRQPERVGALAHVIDRYLLPDKRGDLRTAWAQAEAKVDTKFFEDGEFDPLPRGVRQLRQTRSVDTSLGMRLMTVQDQRRESFARLKRGRG